MESDCVLSILEVAIGWWIKAYRFCYFDAGLHLTGSLPRQISNSDILLKIFIQVGSNGAAEGVDEVALEDLHWWHCLVASMRPLLRACGTRSKLISRAIQGASGPE